MKITVFGAGYVGLVTSTCLAEMGNSVACIDNNQDKVKDFKQGKTKLLGFFIGLAMKISKGKANPKILNKILWS